MQIDTEKLRGKYVYLEPLAEDHRTSLRELAKDERIWEFTREFTLGPAFENDFNGYFTIALDNKACDVQQTFVIRKTADQAMIGMTRLYEISEKDKRVSIGHTWYIPAVWGGVYNKECKLLLLQYVFEEWQFNRTGFYVAGQNLRSQKAVEKIGGVKEGVTRKYGYRNDGTLRDRVMYSIIDEEWPVKKEKLLQMVATNENH